MVFFKVNVQNGNIFGVCLNLKYFLCDNFGGNQHILGLSLRSKIKCEYSTASFGWPRLLPILRQSVTVSFPCHTNLLFGYLCFSEVI